MSDPALHKTAQAYLRMIALGRLLAKLPLQLAYPLAGGMASRVAPYVSLANTFAKFAHQVGIPEMDRPDLWARVLCQHGMFFVNNFLHANKPQQLGNLVDQSSLSWRDFLGCQGPALVLTCHHDFYHSLLVLAGLSGKRVYFVAAPEDSGPLTEWLLPHIRQQHENCVRHFNGGAYLFKNRMAGVREAFDSNGVVFSMHDFDAPGARSYPVRFHNRSYQVPAGTLELALEKRIPIYFGVLEWDMVRKCYLPNFKRLTVDSAAPLAAYAEAMANLIKKNPACWHGWQWFDQFSAISPC